MSKHQQDYSREKDGREREREKDGRQLVGFGDLHSILYVHVSIHVFFF